MGALVGSEESSRSEGSSRGGTLVEVGAVAEVGPYSFVSSILQEM